MNYYISRENLSDILELYADMVMRIAYQNVKNIADAEDICQDVFLKMLELDKSFESEEHIKAFIIRVTINKCKDYYRSSWFKRRVSMKEGGVISDGRVFEKEGKESILESVMELPLNYRNVIYLYYFEGYSVKEIGEILKKKEGTIKTWLGRGREKLKTIIREV